MPVTCDCDVKFNRQLSGVCEGNGDERAGADQG